MLIKFVQTKSLPTPPHITKNPFIIAICIFTTLLSQPGIASNLVDVYEMALKNDPKLKVAQENLSAGLEIKKIARGAFFPQVSTFATYKDANRATNGEFPITLDQDQNILTAEIRALRPVNNKSDEAVKSWGVSVNQVIFDASLWFEYKKGAFQSRQAELQFSADQQDLIMRVLQSYLEVLRANRSLVLSRALQDAELSLLKQSERLKSVGANTTIEVLQAQAALDISVALRLDDENKVTESIQALKFITGNTLNDLWVLPEAIEIKQFNIAEMNEFLTKAKTDNLQIKIAELKKKAANEHSKSMKAQHALTVNAEFRYSKNSTDTHETDNSMPFDFNSKANEGSVQINATMPLFTGGQTSARRRQAVYQYRGAQEEYNSLVSEVERLTTTSYQSIVTSQSRLNARVAALKSTELALSALKRSYQAGAKTLSDVLIAQKNYYSIKREVSNTQFDFILALLQLKLLDASLSPKDVFDINEMLSEPK